MENFVPGTMARWGLDYETLAARNPRLIYASCSGFGQTGPRAHQPAFDIIIQVLAGTMSITGQADGEPVRGGFSVGDIGAALFLAVGILAAVEARHRTGRGQGVVNDKAPMAATLLALKALKRARVPLKGDLLFTGVAGEIGRAPIDEYRGPQYEGKGIGTRYAVTHGVVADYALVAECTNWSYTAVECGCLLVKITVFGKAVSTPFLRRPELAADHPNAIVLAARLVEAIEEWAAEYERRYGYHSRTGEVVPKASVGAIRAGLPYKPIETAGLCALYVDVRVPPKVEPLVPLEELRGLVARLDIQADVQPYLFRRGYEGKNTDLLEAAIETAHRRFFAGPPAEPDPPVSSMWRDLNVFNEIGIPAVTYGPPLGLSSEGWSYFIEVGDIVRAAQLYALIAFDICNQPKS